MPPYHWYWTVSGCALMALNCWCIFVDYRNNVVRAQLVAEALRGLRDPWSDGFHKGLVAASKVLEDRH